MQHNPLHYPTLDRCKKLTELGFPETINGWWRNYWSRINPDVRIHHEKYHFWKWRPLVLPSVIEMMDLIPKDIFYDIFPYQEKQEYFVEIISSTCFKSISSDTIPNALADMIIWLVENDYLSFKK